MRLNDLSKKDTYGGLPDMGRIVETATGLRWFEVIDLKEGYYQIRIKKRTEA
jgi:hypothetical protein